MASLNGQHDLRSGMHPETGMTLLEMVVVLAIMVMVTALAAPALDRARRNAALDRAAVQIIADLDRARETALRTNAAQSITPDVSRIGVSAVEPATFTFRPDGTGDGGPVTLADGARRLVIVVDPISGLARRHGRP